MSAETQTSLRGYGDSHINRSWAVKINNELPCRGRGSQLSRLVVLENNDCTRLHDTTESMVFRLLQMLCLYLSSCRG